jgi:uncharacterized membrane protein
MLQPAEQLVTRPLGSPLTLRVRLALSVLRDEILAGSPALVRIGLIGLALALQTVVLSSPGHFRPATNDFFALLVTVGTLGSLALCFAATLPLKRLLGLRARQLLALATFIALPILAVIGINDTFVGIRAVANGTPYANDGAVMDLYAATKIVHGHDPYVKTNVVQALSDINAPCTTTTPLMEGQFRGALAYPSANAVQQACLSDLRYHATSAPEFESKYNYPAGSILFILPFVWAGMQDMRFLYTLAILAMGAYIWYRMPRSLRVLVPLLLFANVPLIILTGGGQPDPLYALFLMIGFAEWPRRWISPAAVGISIATKQLAWFFVPFYLVFIARKYGWKEALRRGGLMTLIFALTNAPFFVASPSAYLASVTAPMIDPMFPLGIGVMALFVANALPMLPKLAFSVAEICSWIAGTTATALTRYVTPAGTVALAALPLFFAWRSLVNYFYLVPLLTLAVALADARRGRSEGLSTAVDQPRRT